MKLTPLEMIVLFVVLAGIVYGTYSATMDQLPDITGTVMGSTTDSSDIANDSIGTAYVQGDSNGNISVVIVRDTKIYVENADNKEVETNINQLKKGCKVEVHTIGDATDTIPPQIVAEKIVIKKSSG